MSKSKKYDEVSVIRSLSQKHEVSVDRIRKVVEVVKNAVNVGNGTWGKIDYLCHYCGYHAILVNNIKTKPRVFKTNVEIEDDTIKKQFHIAENSKNIMKKIKM